MIMLKKYLAVLPLIFLAGCSTLPTFTRTTPQEQTRNANNLYPVEVIFNSSQQSLRWDSIKAFVIVKDQRYPMKPVPMVHNRWDGFVPVPAGSNSVTYRFKFEYLCNSFGEAPRPDGSASPIYTLTIVDQP